MTDTPVDLRDIVNALEEIKNALPGSTPVVASTLPVQIAFPFVIHNGTHYRIIALAVWSTGAVSPVCHNDLTGHVTILDPDDMWRYSKNHN